MAERFGGRYSPGAKGAPDPAVRAAIAEDRRVDAAGARANLMFLPPAIVAFMAIGDDPVALVTGLGAAAVMALGAWLTREGLRAHAAYDAAVAARKPVLPRKILGAVLTGAGLAGAAWAGGNPIVGAALYGLAAGGLHVAAFGIDPLRDKRVEGIDQFQQDRVARVVDEAETYLTTIREQIAGLADRTLDMRVTSFLAIVRQMIRTVQEDPRDLAEAKRFLVVYLMGARDASVKFADLYRRNRDAEARADYESLLADLETNFAARTQKMLEGGREDMDLEIKVLRDRLNREGVRTQ